MAQAVKHLTLDFSSGHDLSALPQLASTCTHGLSLSLSLSLKIKKLKKIK